AVDAEEGQLAGLLVARGNGFRNSFPRHWREVGAKGHYMNLFRRYLVMLNDVVSDPVCCEGDEVRPFECSAVPFVKMWVFRSESLEIGSHQAEPGRVMPQKDTLFGIEARDHN